MEEKFGFQDGQCPKCGSYDIEYDDTEWDDEFHILNHHCLSCDTTFDVVYRKIPYSVSYPGNDGTLVRHEIEGRNLHENAEDLLEAIDQLLFDVDHDHAEDNVDIQAIRSVVNKIKGEK